MSELPDWQIEIDAGLLRWQADVIAAESLEALRSLEVRALGKAGEIPALMKRIPQILPADRKSFGQAVNALQAQVAGAIEVRRQALVDTLIDAELNDATFDSTQAATPPEARASASAEHSPGRHRGDLHVDGLPRAGLSRNRERIR